MAKSLNQSSKPTGVKNYGSIPHLPGSRLGPGDHSIGGGQARILTVKTRDALDVVYVHEKVDGSNVGIVRASGTIYAVSRSGRLCSGSTLEQHQLFAEYVRARQTVFDFLQEGERLVGEWLAQAHGTRYNLTHEPFVAFDLMIGAIRANQDEMDIRIPPEIQRPKLLHRGGAISIETVEVLLGENGHHGAIDRAEGAVYRVERRGVVDFLAKYVRPGKEDGIYMRADPLVWNWHPRPRK